MNDPQKCLADFKKKHKILKKKKKFLNKNSRTNSLLSFLLTFSSHWLTAQCNFYWGLQEDSFRNCFYRKRLKVFEEKKIFPFFFTFLSSLCLLKHWLKLLFQLKSLYFYSLGHDNSSLFINAPKIFAYRRTV